MKVFFAPMEGVTDYLLRQMFSAVGGYDQCTTEYLPGTNHVHSNEKFYEYYPELKQGGKTLSGTPVFLQLLGGDPGMMAANASRAVELGAIGIDINFGCPARTVNNHDGGAAILKNPHRVYDITSAIRKAVPANVPVTAKIRLGFAVPDHAVEIAQAAEAAECNWLTVHARTRNDAYNPPARWEWIGRIRENVRLPLVANGDIWSLKDYVACVSQTGVRSVMLGRGAFVQPDLAKQIKSGEDETWSWDRMYDFLLRFVRTGFEIHGERYVLNRTKQWLRFLGRNYPEAVVLFQDVKRVATASELIGKLNATTSSGKWQLLAPN